MWKDIRNCAGGAAAMLTSAAMLLCALPAQAATGWESLTVAEKQSSYGYFIWKSENAPTQNEKNAARKAADILKNAPEKDHTSIGAATDATSLANFKEAANEAKRINDFRSAQADEPCRIDLPAGRGRVCNDVNKRLTPLKVTDVLMAIAQSDANYSKSFFNGHAQQYNVSENLSWAPVITYDGNNLGDDSMRNCRIGQSLAACNWYWAEKLTYNANPTDSSAGHYWSLTNKAWGGKSLDEKTLTGVAINSNADYGNVVAQEYSTESLDAYNNLSAPAYSAEEYMTSVSSYVSFVNSLCKVCTVAFDSKGGSPINPQRVESGKTISKPANPTRSGYDFVEWQLNGKTYNFSTPVTKDITLTAKWKVRSTNGYLTRLAGAGRYGTMSSIVDHTFTATSQYVVIASGENFPDALSASSLAGVLNAPIVLTTGDSLNDDAKAQITRLSPKTAIIIGGESAISSNVKSAIENLGITVHRASGDNRFETSARAYQIGKELNKTWSKQAIIASGDNFADALSISSYAYAKKAPIFLIPSAGGLNESVYEALRNGSFSDALVIGGENAVSQLAMSQLTLSLKLKTKRLYGDGRYDTSVRVAQYGLENGMTMSGATFATGENFADALAGGPLAGKNNAVMLLVNSPDSPALKFAGNNSSNVSRAFVLGGQSAVNTNTAYTIANKLGLPLSE